LTPNFAAQVRQFSRKTFGKRIKTPDRNHKKPCFSIGGFSGKGRNFGLYSNNNYMRKTKIFWWIGLCLCLWACTEDSAALLDQARNQAQQGRTEQAFELADKAVKANAQNADALNMRGALRMEKGQTAEALADFNAAIKISGKNYKYFYNRGNAYFQQKDFSAALKDYDQALTLETGMYEIYLNRGTALAALNRNKEAIADYNRAADMNKADKHLYYNRGVAYAMLEDYAKAKADLHYCIQLSPAFAKAHFQLAVVELASGSDTDEACEHLEQAVQLGSQEAKTLLKERCGSHNHSSH
jgi:tetratricopeptide (TPR) repeat protein